MAVTFESNVSTYSARSQWDRINVIKYDASAGTYSYHNDNRTAFDYFTDDATVGDWIGFVWSRGVWHDLVVNVGTAMAGTGITITWEYSQYNAAGALVWATLTVTDGTSGFTVTGSNTVAFSVPDDWRFLTPRYELSGGPTASYLNGPYIRARISALTTITEGGANSTNTLDAKDYAIRVTGTETPESVYVADVAGGWNKMTKLGDSQYLCEANLCIGDGSTTTDFALEHVMMFLGRYLTTNTGTTAYYRKRTLITPFTNAELRLGYNDGSNNLSRSSALYISSYGGFDPYVQTICKLKMYASMLKYLGSCGYDTVYWGGQAAGGDVNVQGCIIAPEEGVVFASGIPSGTNPFYNNVMVIGSSNSFYDYDGDLTISNLTFGRGAGVLAGATCTVSDVNFGSTRVFATGNSGVTADAVNCTFLGTYDAQVNSAGTNNANVMFDLELNVYDSNGAALSGVSCRVKNAAGTTIYNGVYSSAIRLTVYNETGTPVVKTSYDPFEIWVWKTGYRMHYEKLSITNANRKRFIILHHSPTFGRAAMGSDQR